MTNLSNPFGMFRVAIATRSIRSMRWLRDCLRQIAEQRLKPILLRIGHWLVRVSSPPHQVVEIINVRESISFSISSELPDVILKQAIDEEGPEAVVEPSLPIQETELEKGESQVNPSLQVIDSPLPPDEPVVDLPIDDRTVTIVAVCNVLEVLEHQLSDINQDVETSVAGVCKGFQGMAVRAQAAVNAASDSLGSGTATSEGGDKDVIVEMQKVLSLLIENVRASADFTETVSTKLAGLESRLDAVVSTVREVESLANKAKLVALNGQIEAARLGAAGQAFAVVAKETKTLSTYAASTSDSIRVLVGELSAEVRATSSEIRKRIEVDILRFGESENQAQLLLRDIDVSHKKIVKSLTMTSEISGELRGDISRAVMSMQFQDRVSQRIAHVVETLQLLVDQVDPKSIPTYEESAKERSDQWLGQIAKSYTMDSERVAVSQMASPQGANPEGELVSVSRSSSNEEFDVELF